MFHVSRDLIQFILKAQVCLTDTRGIHEVGGQLQGCFVRSLWYPMLRSLGGRFLQGGGESKNLCHSAPEGRRTPSRPSDSNQKCGCGAIQRESCILCGLRAISTGQGMTRVPLFAWQRANRMIIFLYCASLSMHPAIPPSIYPSMHPCDSLYYSISFTYAKNLTLFDNHFANDLCHCHCATAIAGGLSTESLPLGHVPAEFHGSTARVEAPCAFGSFQRGALVRRVHAGSMD